jgi:hypothetical protein
LIRETLIDLFNDIEIELIIDKLRKKIYDGGRIEVSDLNEIETAGWKVPQVVWEVVKNR